MVLFDCRAVSQVSAVASSSRDPELCDQMKGSLIKKQVGFRVIFLVNSADGCEVETVHLGW